MSMALHYCTYALVKNVKISTEYNYKYPIVEKPFAITLEI